MKISSFEEIQKKCQSRWDAIPTDHRRALKLVRRGLTRGQIINYMSPRGDDSAIKALVEKGWIRSDSLIHEQNKTTVTRFIDTFQAVAEKQINDTIGVLKLKNDCSISFDVSRDVNGLFSTGLMLAEVKGLLDGMMFFEKAEFDLSLSDEFILTIKRIA